MSNKNHIQKAQKKQSLISYFNSHFPPLIKEKFETERQISHQAYDKELEESFQNRDYNQLFNDFCPKKAKIDHIYGLNSARQIQLSEYLLHMGLEENYITLDSRFFYCSFQTKSIINWQPLWKELLRRIFQNDITNTNTQDISPQETQAYLQIIKKLRHKFDDSSIQEVYDLYTKLCVSNNELLGLILIRYFLKISRKTNQSYYQKIFDETICTLNYDLSKRKQLVSINFLYELAITHPELDWQNSYENLFSFISKYYLQLLPLGLSTKQQQQKTNYLSLQNINNCIQNLIVHLIVPSTFDEKHSKIWDYINRLFNIISQYLHPNSEGSGAVKFLLQQLQQFIHNYIHLDAYQKKKVKSLEKAIENIKKKLNQDQQCSTNQDKMQEDLEDQGIENELLNENSVQNMQNDHFCEIKKDDDNMNDINDLNGGNMLNQQKFEDEINEEDQEDDEDEEEEDEDEEKSKKTQEEIKQNLEKKLENLEQKL
ncbi:hypothetical protein IMG5_152350, partial [Ichthyophthirius multifiliis]